MKNKLLTIAYVSLLSVGYVQVTSADVQHGKNTCSLKTLKGSYMYASSGTSSLSGAIVDYSDAGIATYDGHGNFTDSVSVNGDPTVSNYIGTYTVNRNCTGTLTYTTDDTHYNIFVSPDGSILNFVQTDAGTNISGEEKRVAK